MKIVVLLTLYPRKALFLLPVTIWLSCKIAAMHCVSAYCNSHTHTHTAHMMQFEFVVIVVIPVW